MSLGEQIWCVLSEEMSFVYFISYGPMLMEKRSKNSNLNFKFHNSFNNFGRDLPSPSAEYA